ncbi:hypothetical protein ACF09C_24620 [Streptomyces sp. NPDC014870]|uniref:hypothetical protein n=1 Tax=Streptomyces sp. NPDC014870 TaxID=3364925 RepID=UPI0036F75AA0
MRQEYVMSKFRKPLVILAVAALACGGLAAGAALADTPVTLTVGHASGECAVSWQKDGIGFVALPAGSSARSIGVSDGVGTISADLSQFANPGALAKTVTFVGTFKAHFVLYNSSGGYVELSDGQATLPAGPGNLLVKTGSNPSGTRMSVFDYAKTPTITAERASMVPPSLAFKVGDVQMSVTAEFAKVVNDNLGAGTIEAGTRFGTCSAEISS